MTTIDIANKWKDIGIDRELVYFDSAVLTYDQV
jgi:hypothetical protein